LKKYHANDWDDMCRKYGVKPILKETCKDGDLLIGDSGYPFFGKDNDGNQSFIYRTAYAIQRDVLEFGAFNNYDATEFASMSKREGQQKRINECLVYARDALAISVKAGLYDGRESHSIH